MMFEELYTISWGFVILFPFTLTVFFGLVLTAISLLGVISWHEVTEYVLNVFGCAIAITVVFSIGRLLGYL